MSTPYGATGSGHEIILTFDDGPHPKNTPKLLDLLKAENLKAVFFVVGSALGNSANLDIVKRAHAEGHTIGNHTFSHPSLTKLTAAEVEEEILKTENLLGGLLGEHKLIRPPFGAHNQVVDAIFQRLGYTSVLWNVDPRDWDKEFQPTGWIDSAVEQISKRAHSTMLTHDIHKSTVDNFKTFIDKTRATVPGASFIQY